MRTVLKFGGAGGVQNKTKLIVNPEQDSILEKIDDAESEEFVVTRT